MAFTFRTFHNAAVKRKRLEASRHREVGPMDTWFDPGNEKESHAFADLRRECAGNRPVAEVAVANPWFTLVST